MFLTPRWLASHLLVVVLVTAFIAAGFWQVQRLGQRQEVNQLVMERLDVVVTLDDALSSASNDGGELEFRRVQVTGQYDVNREVLIANRSREGVSGFWLWTVFDTDGGDEIIVNRGFVDRANIVQLPNPTVSAQIGAEGVDLTLQGLLRVGDLEARLSEDGTQLTRPDAVQARQLLGATSAVPAEVYLQLEAQDPSRVGDLPIPVPLPDLSEGPHRSYAFQWFTFATIGVIGYGVLLRRIVRGDQRRGDVPLDESIDPVAV